MERQEDALELSETELEILHLYDKLQQLRIELSLMRTRQEHAPYDQGPAEEVTEDMLRDAQDELLHARASYSLTNSAIENVLVVNPILRAVHSATEASPVERDLLPYVEQRDILSQNSLKRTAELQSLVNRIRHVEVDAIKISRENRVLAAEVLRLAEQANPSHANMQLEPGTQKELQRLEKEVKSSRQKWKVIKGTASAVVAGSGVDWTRDEQLTDMVLDKD